VGRVRLARNTSTVWPRVRTTSRPGTWAASWAAAEPDLHEFKAIEHDIKFGAQGRGHPGFTDVDVGLERVGLGFEILALAGSEHEDPFSMSR